MISDYIFELYKVALGYGLSLDTFWNSTVLEISDYIKNYNREKEREKREEVSLLFMLSNLIAERNPFIDADKRKLSMPWDYYPKLFEKERILYEKEKEEEEFQKFKEERMAAMAAHNRMRGGVE